MTKIDIDERQTPSGCGCEHSAKEESDAHHDAAAEHDCCGDAADLEGSAHRHEEGCCGGSHAADETHHNHSSSNRGEGPKP